MDSFINYLIVCMRRIWPYVVLVVLLIPLIRPLFHLGFFITDDGDWMVIRLAAFHQTLRSGQFPVRFLFGLNHGYGYPVTNFLYPLPFYLGELIHLLGFGFIDSVKILFGASFILGAFFMYRYAGLAAAIVYSFFPYRIFDTYTRGSLGEAISFIFLPLIFYLIDKKKIIFASIATAALICSHNVIAFIFLPIILVYAYLKTKSRWFISCILFLGASLSAWFWLPALYDLQYVRAGSVQISNFLQYFSNYFDPTIILAISVCLLARKHKFFVITTLISLFLALPVSGIIWQNSPLDRLTQFPWRFLAVTSFGVSILVSKLNFRISIIVALIVIVLGLFSLKIDRTFKPDSYYETNDDTTTVKNEYMPKWVKTDPTSRSNDQKTVYFPGIKSVTMGKEIEPLVDDNGMVTGAIVFRETPIRFFANALSIATFLIICVLLLI